ncbi:hypothetical protein CYMTET_16782 [Cymbomonas tetramitiformis]|uniref:Uncharacterized protein n=1 Tax=Cymbomonas tetramitiformis TaxID=36881 RepID=A0AAE0GBE4_9CHLO|nr:hypothetical protein CYMTET_16782 [Cymbomonas tetramitiformis]
MFGRTEAEHLHIVRGGQREGTVKALSGGAPTGAGGPSQAASGVQDIMAEWDDSHCRAQRVGSGLGNRAGWASLERSTVAGAQDQMGAIQFIILSPLG